MAGQDQSIPNSTEPPRFQISPLIPAAPVPAPPVAPPAGNAVVQPPQSQAANTSGDGSQSSADVGAGLLSDIFSAKKSQIDLTQQAMQKNAGVDDAATQQVNTLYDSSMAAFQNLQKIDRWHATGVTGILGLFDSDWNPKVQKDILQGNQIAATQITDRAAAMKEANNRAPALAALSGQLATEAYTTYSDYRKLQLQDITTRIQMQAANRQQEIDAVDNLGLNQKIQALQQAKAGKGPWVGFEGILEKGITDEQQAHASLSQTRLAVASGNDELAQKQLNRFVSYLPAGKIAPLVQDAMKNGQAVVTMPTDNKGGKINIPLPLLQQRLLDANKTEQDLTQQAAVQKANDLSIPTKINETTNSASALAAIDPRAANEMSVIHNNLTSTDWKDLNSVRTTSDALDQSMARIKAIGDDVAKTYSTPEAQQAVKNYVSTGGVFDSKGAQAVVADTVGNFGATNTAKFKDAFNILNATAANKIAAQQNNGMNWEGTNGSGTMDTATAMALLAGNKKMLKDSTIIDNMLADPQVNQQVVQSVQNTIKPQALITTIQSLASDKGAAPIWAQLLQHPESWAVNGALSTRKLMDELESQSAVSGYKANYGNALATRLQKYGTTADQDAQRDPSYSLADRALVAKTFGAHPQASIIGTLYKQLRVMGDSAHEKMKQRIQQDISGVDPTQTYAIPGQTTGDINPKQTVPANQRPSATGLPLTAAQIQAMFAGGIPQ